MFYNYKNFIHLISTYQVSSAKLDSQSAQRMKSLLPWPGLLEIYFISRRKTMVHSMHAK